MLEVFGELVQLLGACVVLLTGLAVVVCHLGDMFDTLRNLLCRGALFAGAVGDFAHGGHGGQAFLLDFP